VTANQRFRDNYTKNTNLGFRPQASLIINHESAATKSHKEHASRTQYSIPQQKKLSQTGADVPGVGLYWLTECLTGTFW